MVDNMIGPPARFDSTHIKRPALSGISVITTLAHFAIISYLVEPAKLRTLVHERFDLETIPTENGEKALISAVPFEDQDFRFIRCPYPKFRFGQTNYRAYIIDRKTGRRAVWFFGTVLDSWTVLLPRLGWKLPWHRGSIRFDCDHSQGKYQRYALKSESDWAPMEFRAEEIAGTAEHPGFADAETALVALSHPFDGFYYRRDGSLGSYRVWHEPLDLRPGRCLDAQFGLFSRLDLVAPEDQAQPYSVLLQRETEFAVYLPPRRVDLGA